MSAVVSRNFTRGSPLDCISICADRCVERELCEEEAARSPQQILAALEDIESNEVCLRLLVNRDRDSQRRFVRRTLIFLCLSFSSQIQDASFDVMIDQETVVDECVVRHVSFVCLDSSDLNVYCMAAVV